MITKKIFPVFNTEDGDCYMCDGEIAKITGSRAEYRLFGILLYAKTLYNPWYYKVQILDEWVYEF